MTYYSTLNITNVCSSPDSGTFTSNGKMTGREEVKMLTLTLLKLLFFFFILRGGRVWDYFHIRQILGSFKATFMFFGTQGERNTTQK